MEKVFITGISGYIGSKLASRLIQIENIKEIVGIDIVQPHICHDKVIFYKRDIREPIEHILNRHTIDTVVHLAYVVAPIHHKRLMEDINVGGTRNVLEACASSGIKHLLYTSSATAYGFHADNDVPLTEDSPLRGNDDFTYSKTKKEIEAVVADYISRNHGIVVTIIRPSFVVGPGFDDPLARHLKKRIVLLPSNTQPFQFVHEDDLINIICILLQRRAGGIFNIGADGTITSDEMVKLLGNISIRLNFNLMYVLTRLAWTLRLSFVTQFPSAALNLARYHWVVTSEKLKRELGYEYKYTTKEAYRDFVRSVKGSGSNMRE